MNDRQTEEIASPGGDVSQESEQEQLLHEIEGTRAELGDTVDALAQKADVKARVSERIEQQKAAWRERQKEVKTRVDAARERASHASPDEARRAASQVARTAEERPWPAIALALGLGVLIGRALGRR